MSEIEVPKELREFMPDGAEETVLGQRNGAIRQYRYGNLHIREYQDKFLVHTDLIDPRKDPLGHLIKDAPEVLVGLACTVLGGAQMLKGRGKKPSHSTKIISSIAFGYLGYVAAKKLKECLE